MENNAYLYLMLSRTGTGMGKVIRLFTRGEYNHVSLTLDGSFRSFVSFARYVQDVPLAGGFVEESAERFLSCGSEIPVRIFRLEISQAAQQQLAELFSLAGNADHNLIYNSLGALCSIWHGSCPVPGAYTCLEFAGAVLNRKFRSLQELEAFLAPFQIFRGNLEDILTDTGSRSTPYFTHRGFWRGTADTLFHFTRLAGRILRIDRCDDPIKTYTAK